jgi:hypothetical protein
VSAITAAWSFFILFGVPPLAALETCQSGRSEENAGWCMTQKVLPPRRQNKQKHLG